MRVMLATWATASHYFSTVILAWALRAAGHEVRVVASPGVEDAVLRSGLPLTVIGPPLDLASVWKGFGMLPDTGGDAAAHERARSARALSMFTMGAEQTVDELTGFARAFRPDVVVYEPRMYAAIKAAREVGAPAVRLLPGPDYTGTRREAEREALDELWERLKLGDADPLGDLTLDPCPPGLQVDLPVVRQRMRFVPYNGPAIVPPWTAEPPSARRVFISLGTLVATLTGQMSYVRDVIEAAASLDDVEVVLGVFGDQTALLGPLDPRVRVVEDMPLHLLLPTCSAVVHHGGSGTLLTTMSAGVPQLVLSSVGDTLLNGRQITASGAGLATVGLAGAAPERIREALGSLLAEPSYGLAARALAAENTAQPAVGDVVRELERLAAS
ncbi:nucleotide disphospho-sugar-binding domain-containing protein [Rhizohabitans arisaemae]|uniref:nucleotide disphospho-sugar-binding domain-containing protein n=1 Tax=Rhizohabitans arisaemae TaxID=2720610 RepID=UPI0024B0BCA9|nr:nucleotide disphospho-sugar-binding domain-containing protein [Rhizohabitans arisaemae]